MKFIIHSGFHKTASTTFQRICMQATKILEKNRIFFPKYKNWEQHSYAARLLQKQDFEGLKKFLFFCINEARKKNCNAVLISGEDFENLFIDLNNALRFEETAYSSGFSEIQWIIVKRETVDYIKSIYAEKCIYGVCLNIENIINSAKEYGFSSLTTKKYNYLFVFDIRRFETVFRKTVNSKLKIYDFVEFKKNYVGKVLLDEFITNRKDHVLIANAAQEIGVTKKRLSDKEVEFRYTCSFLGLAPTRKTLEDNKNLFNSLINQRMIKKNAAISTLITDN